MLIKIDFDKQTLQHLPPALFFTVSALLLPLSVPQRGWEWGLELVHISTHISSNSFLLLLPSHIISSLQHGLSICHSSLWEYSPAPLWCSPEALVWMTAPGGPLPGCREIPAPLVSSPCSSPPLVLAGLLVTFFPLSPGCSCSFLPSLNTFSQRPSRARHPELAVPSTGQRGRSSRAAPAPSCATDTQHTTHRALSQRLTVPHFSVLEVGLREISLKFPLCFSLLLTCLLRHNTHYQLPPEQSKHSVSQFSRIHITIFSLRNCLISFLSSLSTLRTLVYLRIFS